MTLQLGSHGPLVSRWTDVMLKRFRSYALGRDGLPLRNDGYYGYDEAGVQKEYERRTGQAQDGIVSDHDLGALGLAKPIIFTVEGHLADMFVGPCAFTAQALAQQGVAVWQPVGYDNVSLPFHNQSGVDELNRLLSLTTLDNGTPFPPGTPFGLIIFSQGGIVGSRVLLEDLRPDNGRLHWRYKDLKRAVAFGNPYREKNVIAPWVPDPPSKDTQGIADVHIDHTPAFWMEHSRHGDGYAENPDDEVGLNRTAIYKIVSENSWAGGPAGMLARIIDLLGNPFDGFIDMARSIIGFVMFVGNMAPHGMYDLGPDIEWMRGVAA